MKPVTVHYKYSLYVPMVQIGILTVCNFVQKAIERGLFEILSAYLNKISICLCVMYMGQ